MVLKIIYNLKYVSAPRLELRTFHFSAQFPKDWVATTIKNIVLLMSQN